MDLSKFTGLTDLWKLTDAAQAKAVELGEEDPELFATQVLGALLNLKYDKTANDDKLKNVLDLFRGEDNLKSFLYAADASNDKQPVTVTETSVSLPKDTEINREGIAGDMTPEEEQMLDQAINPEEDDVFAQILNANTDEELQAALGITGDNKPAEDSSADEPPADFSDTDKTSAEEAADKPKEEKPAEPKPEEKKEEKSSEEEKPAESKPEEKKEEPKEEKPKETSKDESDDTMKNITSALSDRF
ncbi:MAG: hypothetical protein IKQ22_00685 [Clostridia bacterium]|nr:hypothetical protein [Clostridia bacterium]